MDARDQTVGAPPSYLDGDLSEGSRPCSTVGRLENAKNDTKDGQSTPLQKRAAARYWQ